ncbi:MAG: class I SAM-dependent methyltransferase [Xanthomonadaceae bacterium]|jgi:2-polyprenyl-3-methyl-5-hydroxy-6-metoxy-1,4-benzoquinol methylase/ribosomal protein S15P/S13E|nr:class I SAM-dependent methyltransferase [Xanthomonadaceae bacterium]
MSDSLAQTEKSLTECWCGNSNFTSYGPDYMHCLTCDTLVSQKGLSHDQTQVTNDEDDFYGKKYWLDHQQQDLSQPGILERARTDIPERNLYWLEALLKYKLPPATTLELGCAHGSFVALMQQTCFSASGMEMSPWVVDYARKTFAIDVHLGPIESVDIPAASLDCIVMMDVMEHLPDPMASMSHIQTLLKPDGIFLIQMPNFCEDRYETLIETQNPFLVQLKADEHLFLYSKRASQEFFHRIGFEYIYFEPAIFSHYDMFFVASRIPLQTNTKQEIEASLLATPGGRIILGMLDLKKQLEQARMFEHDRNLLRAQLADLRQHFENSEKDREARAEIIEEQGKEIGLLHVHLHELMKKCR